jgi:hypothetical protein
VLVSYVIISCVMCGVFGVAVANTPFSIASVRLALQLERHTEQHKV